MSALKCLDCGSESLLVYTETSYWLNTGEHYCNSIKAHDAIARVRCDTCGWEGKRCQVETDSTGTWLKDSNVNGGKRQGEIK